MAQFDTIRTRSFPYLHERKWQNDEMFSGKWTSKETRFLSIRGWENACLKQTIFLRNAISQTCQNNIVRQLVRVFVILGRCRLRLPFVSSRFVPFRRFRRHLVRDWATLRRSNTDRTNSEAGQTAGYKTHDRQRSQRQSRLNFGFPHDTSCKHEGRDCFPRHVGLRAGRREVHDQIRQHRLGFDPEQRPSAQQLRKLPVGCRKLYARRQGA